MDTDRFPCLSTQQPWADLILGGAKDVENKKTRTHFRGTILLHASATINAENLDWFEGVAHKRGLLKKNEAYEPVFGAILGAVNIVDCVTQSESGFFEGPFGWCVANPIPFDEPIPYKGAVGIFYVPRRLLRGTPVAKATPGKSTAMKAKR